MNCILCHYDMTIVSFLKACKVKFIIDERKEDELSFMNEVVLNFLLASKKVFWLHFSFFYYPVVQL